VATWKNYSGLKMDNIGFFEVLGASCFCERKSEAIWGWTPDEMKITRRRSTNQAEQVVACGPLGCRRRLLFLVNLVFGLWYSARHFADAVKHTPAPSTKYQISKYQIPASTQALARQSAASSYM